jgi:hypothetical protein
MRRYSLGERSNAICNSQPHQSRHNPAAATTALVPAAKCVRQGCDKASLLTSQSALKNFRCIFKHNEMHWIDLLIDRRHRTLRLETSSLQIGTNCTSHRSKVRLRLCFADVRAQNAGIERSRATKCLCASKRTANGEEGLTNCCRGADQLRREVANEEGLVVYFPRMRSPIRYVLRCGCAS